MSATKTGYILFLLGVSLGQAAIDLPTFNVDQNDLTVSGVSSGAIFASQFHVAYSSTIKGCGTWAGVPYLCYSQAGLFCMTSAGVVSTSGLIKDTDKFATDGDIDDTGNLAGSKQVKIVQIAKF